MKFACPTAAFDCPCYNRNGSCALAEDGLDPTLECDDAAFYADDVEAQEQFYNAFYS